MRVWTDLQVRQSWGIWGVATPQILGKGSLGSQGALGVSWTGREILLLITSYRVQEVRSKVVTFEEK